MDITQDQLLQILQTTLGAFREEFDSDISAARILTLLSIVQNPGMQQKDLADHVKGLSQSAASRNILDWSSVNSSRKAGPDFVEQRNDPMYRKRNLLYPTAKGHQFVTRLTANVNAAVKRKQRAGTETASE